MIILQKCPGYKKKIFSSGFECDIIHLLVGKADIMDRRNIEKIAKTTEDRILLAKIWDKIRTGMQRNIPANTCFLSPRELELSRFLFGNREDLLSSGGYADAERKMLVYLPEYLDADWLQGDDSPIQCVRANYYEADMLTHRDLLGALMGCGIARECVGDICVGNGVCDFFVTSEIAPYLLQNLTEAGRVKLHIGTIPLSQVSVPQLQTKEIRDTVSSLRLDSVISSGFRIGRGLAAQQIIAGKAAIDGFPCEKPDKTLNVGSKISVRGLGKIKLESVNGQTKKGRISVVIHRYI